MQTSQVKNPTDIIKDMKYLDPKLDIVFKLLMQQDKSLLQSMIETIVKLPAPIEALEVLNPELPKEIGIDKGVILDVRVSLANQARFDVEMQSQLPAGIKSRFLYYWAKEYCSELNRGDDYVDLLPVISIIWLEKSLFSTKQFHNIFHLSEDTSREIFCHDLEIHTLELRGVSLNVSRRSSRNPLLTATCS